MIKIVQTKPICFEAIFYDGSLDVFEEMKAWVRRNGGELFVEKNERKGTEMVLLHCRRLGTVTLNEGSWVVRRAQDHLTAHTPEELNEEFDIL